MKISLPSGASVTLKDPKTLKVKHRKAIITASEAYEGQLSRAYALGDALIACMVEEWSFDLLIPSVQIQSLDELTPEDYDTLQEACKDVQKYLFPSLSKNDENDNDPKATTANSNA